MFPISFLFAIFFALAIAEETTTNNPDPEKNHVKVQVLEREENCRKIVKLGDVITIHYNASYERDPQTFFDSSYKRGHPLQFEMGKNEVIPGLDRGLLESCEGERRMLTVPHGMATGLKGVKLEPGNSPLLFSVHVIEIREGGKPPNVFKEVDVDGNKKLTKEEVAIYFKRESTRLSMNVTDMDISDMVWEVFEIDDRNKDGEISRREFSGPIHASDEF